MLRDDQPGPLATIDGGLSRTKLPTVLLQNVHEGLTDIQPLAGRLVLCIASVRKKGVNGQWRTAAYNGCSSIYIPLCKNMQCVELQFTKQE